MIFGHFYLSNQFPDQWICARAAFELIANGVLCGACGASPSIPLGKRRFRSELSWNRDTQPTICTFKALRLHRVKTKYVCKPDPARSKAQKLSHVCHTLSTTVYKCSIFELCPTASQSQEIYMSRLNCTAVFTPHVLLCKLR